MKRNAFEFILGPSFGIILVFFLFIIQSLAQVAPAFALHLRFVSVLAKCSSNAAFVELIVKEDKALVESLSQEADQQ